MFDRFSFDCWLYRKTTGYSSPSEFISTSFGRVRFIDTGESSLPILVMVPDGPCFLEHFTDLIAAAQASFRVIVFDMPGFGYSAPQEGYNHSFDHAVQVIREVLENRGVQNQKVIMAFSCGNGFYALNFAKRFPERIQHLFLIQTPAFRAMWPWLAKSVPQPLKVPFLGQALTYLWRFKIPRIWYQVSLPRHSDLATQYCEKTLREIKNGACNCLAGVVQGLMKMSEDDLAGVQVPVTMLWGKKDFSHRMTNPISLKALVPQAEILIREDLGHFANLEDPEGFLKVVQSRIR